MEFKGTNGKWFISEGEKTKTGFKTTLKSKNNITETLCVVKSKSYEESKANALLISKAPEMLEMLKKHLGILYDIEMEDSGDNVYLKNLIVETKQIIKEATEL